MHCILLEASTPGRDPATTWIAIAVGIMAVVYVTLVKPLRGKKQRQDPLERARVPSGLAQQRAVEGDMSNLLVELSAMARQMTGQLDVRAAKLELLIKDADERIATLRAMGPSANVALPAGSSPANDATFALEQAVSEAKALRGLVLPEQRIDPRHAQVYDLADDGCPPHEIARQLDRPSGEIELILALRGSPAAEPARLERSAANLC